MAIYKAKSKLHGKGIFILKNIKRGEKIATINGNIVTHHVINKKTSAVGKNWIGFGKNKWIDTIYPFNSINHSCNPNVGIKGSRTVVALKNIKKGDELLLDYSITESDRLWTLDKKCKCGSRNCRKIIKSIQYLPKKIYNKYMPYIPKYFQKEYFKYHKENGK